MINDNKQLQFIPTQEKNNSRKCLISSSPVRPGESFKVNKNLFATLFCELNVNRFQYSKVFTGIVKLSTDAIYRSTKNDDGLRQMMFFSAFSQEFFNQKRSADNFLFSLFNKTNYNLFTFFIFSVLCFVLFIFIPWRERKKILSDLLTNKKRKISTCCHINEV
jgi:hypothetical protein